jgi:hypothetical protein
MNTPTDLRALVFATALVHGDASILAPVARVLGRFARSVFAAMRRPRHISAVTRSALVRDGYSIDHSPVAYGGPTHQHHNPRRTHP